MKAHLLRTGKRAKAQNIRQFFHGTVTDRAMRQWLSLDDPQSGQMAEWIEQIIEREEQEAKDSGDGVVRWRSVSDRTEMTQFCVELVNRLEPLLAEHVLPYEYEPAKKFRVPFQVDVRGQVQDVQLVGEMDILGRSPQGWFVWDLKATRDDSYWRKTIGQLIFYDLAVWAAFGDPTYRSGLIQPMCSLPLVDITVTDQQRAELVQRIAAFVDAFQYQTQAPRADSKYCSWCAVSHACPKFRPVNGGRVKLIASE